MAVNKIVINKDGAEETLIDLSGDTVTAETLPVGVTAHNAQGEQIVGTMVQSSGFHVGDILTTVRTDMDDTWLLCNGDTIITEEYSELAKFLPQLPIGWESVDFSDYINRSLTCAIYANGYYVIGGVHYDAEAETYCARIAYSASKDGEWTVKDIGQASDGLSVDCITYANGYWVVGGTYLDGESAVALAYTLDIDGEWSFTPFSITRVTAVTSVAYGGGYWVATLQIQSGSAYTTSVAYATSLDGTWSRKSISSLLSTCIAYANGNWVIGGRIGNSASVAYASSPTETWETASVAAGSSANPAKINCIAYGDDRWVAGGSVYNTSFARYCASVFLCASPGGTWSQTTVWTGTDSGQSIDSLAFPGALIVGGIYCEDNVRYARIAVSKTFPSLTWIHKANLWSTEDSTLEMAVTGIVPGWFAVGYTGGDSADAAPMFARSTQNEADLPTISVDGAYTYIKAKED